jgi:hypothetical protein
MGAPAESDEENILRSSGGGQKESQSEGWIPPKTEGFQM